MPGSVALAAPATVLPRLLCLSLRHERAYPLLANDYRDGSSQRSLQAATSRKLYVARLRKTATELVGTWRTFYDARKGPHEPFYAYIPSDTSPKFSYDQTGVATTGRLTMRFGGEWNQFFDFARGEFEIRLVEIA